MQRDWLTSAEAAELSGFTVVHVARLCQERKLVCEKRSRIWFVQRASLLSYLQDWHPDIFERIIKRGE